MAITNPFKSKQKAVGDTGSSDSSPGDDEKVIASGKEIGVDDGMPPDPDEGLSAKERAKIDRRLLWKLDLRLIPWLCLLYLISFIDRTNIGNARLDGLEQSLDLTAGQYNACLSIFFVSYACFEPLTNILLKRLRPSIFIPCIMLLWGLVMVTMGLCHNYAGMMTARWWLGVAEAGLFPGINYYLSCWYKRNEFGIRAAIFFSAAAVSGSFGGLLAAAIGFMDGIGGKKGWAWIFILEGLATMVVAVASFWMVYDFPDETTFLDVDDKRRVIRRLKEDKQSSAEHEEFKISYFWASVKDWKTWLYAVIYMGCDGPLYAFSLFLPTIISDGLGFKGTTAQLLSVPPYATAAILTIAIGWFADSHPNTRGLCNIYCSLLGIVGFAMLVAGTSPAVQYTGTFLGALGIYPCIANTIVWTSNNTEGVYKRGVTLGFAIGWGNLNGVVSSNIYQKKDSPLYRTGHGIVLGYMAVFLLGGSILQCYLLKKENAKRLTGGRDGWIEGKSEHEIEMLGDKRPDFVYTL